MELLKFFVSNLLNGGYSFGEIFAFFASVLDSVKNNQELVTLWGNISKVLSTISLVLPLILLVFSVLQMLFGKKLLGLTRFLIFFISGYCIGVDIISPIINRVLVLPNYLSGFVIAFVVSVLCRYLYFAILGITVGYGTYLLLISYVFLDNFFFSFIIALCALVSVFVFRKYVEMVLSAALGGYFVSLVIRLSYFDYVKAIGTYGWIMELALVLILCTLGSIYQVKHRSKFK